MLKEIIVNSSPNEVRVALLEDREVVEFSMERAESRRAVGNVYKGVVTAVRPGLQAAFVEIGMDKAGFLHVSDLIHDDPEDDDDGGRGGRRRRRGRREGLRPIETMLKEGDELLVQVTKEIIGTKGPRLTADISLPGRFMVLMPKGDHVGVSRKIEDRKERHRLRDLLAGMKPDDEGGAFIIRTAAVGVEPKMLQRDMEYLRNLWKEIQTNAHSVKAPAVVHQDVGLLIGMIRDIFKDDIDSLIIDSRDEYNELMQHVRNFSPELRERIHLYEGDIPLFDKFGVEQELKKSLERKVWMKRGGFLVIDEAEALVAIDVNTGRYTGRKNQAETIFKTNMLAAREIARQLRLRDVGGIIVCDFIDMDSEEDKRKVLNELRTHLKRDRARTKTFPVTDLGLVEMSRQRVQESLKDRLSDDCPYCGGGGQVLSTDTLANKVERLLLKLAATGNEKAVQVRANPTLALVLMTDRANGIQNIARSTGIRVDVIDDPRLHREQFQIVSLHRRKDLVAEIEKAAGERRDDVEARPADTRRRGRRDEEGSDRDRGARRRPRRQDEDEAPARTDERRPARGESAGDSGSAERPARRRRGRDDQRPAPAEAATQAAAQAEPAKTPAPAPAAGHPAEDSEDSPRRRRRRRGRRGGRGRRRRGEGENETQDASSTRDSRPARAETGSPRQPDPGTAREDRDRGREREDDGGREARRREERPARQREESRDASPVAAAEERQEAAREEPRAEASWTDAAPAAASPDGRGEDDGDTSPDGTPRRRRRTRKRGSRGGAGRSEAKVSPEPAVRAESEPEAEPARGEVLNAAESRAGSDPDADEVRAPRRSGRSERGPQKPVQGEAVASRENYVRPVPEEEWMEQVQQLKEEARLASPADADEPAAQPPLPDVPRDQKTGRRRRRRQRSTGTPTRLIGTGRTGADDD